MNNLSQLHRLDLGSIIRKRRKVLGITQTVLADLSGVGIHSISDIESGKGNPTLEVAKKLLATLGLKFVVQIAAPNHLSSPTSSPS